MKDIPVSYAQMLLFGNAVDSWRTLAKKYFKEGRASWQIIELSLNSDEELEFFNKAFRCETNGKK